MKPTKAEKIAARSILQRLIENYRAQDGQHAETDGVLEEIDRIWDKFETEKHKLLSPKPRAPRKPTSRKQETVVPVPSGLQHTSDVRKRGKR